MQQKRGVASAAATGPTATNIIHQDSTAMPLTSTIASLVQRLTRLNTAIKHAMSKGEEEKAVQEGYRR